MRLPISSKKGFTLLELIIAVSALAVLFIAVVIAIKPHLIFVEARDTKRSLDLKKVSTAIHKCLIDNNEKMLDTNDKLARCIGPHNVSEVYEIVTGSVNSGCDDVCTDVTSDTHCLPLDKTLANCLAEVPRDPNIFLREEGHTNYQIKIYENGMIVLEACSAEGGSIRVSR